MSLLARCIPLKVYLSLFGLHNEPINILLKVLDDLSHELSVNILVSSANIFTVLWTTSGKSLIHKMKSSGPNR